MKFFKTETEARSLRCCGPYPCGFSAYDGHETAQPFGQPERYCLASQCMAWIWVESDFEQARTDNRTIDLEMSEKHRIKWMKGGGNTPPPPPPGDGWVRFRDPVVSDRYHDSLEQEWRRPRDNPRGRWVHLERVIG